MAKANWLTVSPTSGSGDKTVTISAAAYTGRVERSCAIEVSDGAKLTRTLTVKQSPKAEYVSLDVTTKSITSASQTLGISGKSNSSKLTITVAGTGITAPTTYVWRLNNTFGANNGEAINGDPGATTEYIFNLSVNIAANLRSARKQYVYVTANGGQKATLTISQAGQTVVKKGKIYIYERLPTSGYEWSDISIGTCATALADSKTQDSLWYPLVDDYNGPTIWSTGDGDEVFELSDLIFTGTLNKFAIQDHCDNDDVLIHVLYRENNNYQHVCTNDDYYYGITKEELESLLNNGTDVVIVIQPYTSDAYRYFYSYRNNLNYISPSTLI